MSSVRAIGLTGGIACGKSEVAGILMTEGVPVFDADAEAHALLEPGHWIYEKIVQTFGRQYVKEEGGIDRKKLGKLVFDREESRRALNGIMHPEIFDRMHAWMREQLERHDQAVAMIPLLYETGAEKFFDKVITVAADEPLVIARLMNRGCTPEEARARMRSQMPAAEKNARADAVIWNNDDLRILREKTIEVWRKITL